MKLATFKDGSRDGQLMVVSRDLASAHFATGIASRLQQVLDDWNFVAPQLEDLSHALNHGKARHAFPFDPRQAMAPLPRATRWIETAASLAPLERRRAADGEALPPRLRSEPLSWPVACDDLRGPTDEVALAADDGASDAGDPARYEPALDFEGGLVVVTGDVPQGVAPAAALEAVRLIGLACGWVLRDLARDERDRGAGAVRSRLATAMSPVLATPEELGDHWQGGRVHGTLEVRWNDRIVGRVDAGAAQHFHVGQCLAHAARHGRLRAGTALGTGPLGGADGDSGWCCVADARARADGASPAIGWVRRGDRVRIALRSAQGDEPCGAIDQAVAVD